MKIKNKISLRLKIVVGLFLLSVISLSYTIFMDVNRGVYDLVMENSFFLLLNMFIVFGLVALQKWAYYLALLDQVAILAKGALAFPLFLDLLNAFPEIKSGEIPFATGAAVGLIPVIITLYIVFALMSEKGHFKE